MTKCKIESNKFVNLEETIYDDLSKEYGLKYYLGAYVKFKYSGKPREGRIIGFDSDTKEYKITYKNEQQIVVKKHNIEIMKDDVTIEEYDLNYYIGAHVKFKYRGKQHEGRIIGFNPDTKEYKITYSKNHIIEIAEEKHNIEITKDTSFEEKLAPLIVSLLDKNDILSMSTAGMRGKKKVCIVDFDFKKIIETFLLSERFHKSKPQFLLKHYTLGGERQTKAKPSDPDFCPALRFKHGEEYLDSVTENTAFYCNQASYSKLIRKIFKKRPRELGYLLIYLSIVLGRNLSILDKVKLTSGDICSYLSRLNEMDDNQVAKKIEELATEILECLGLLRCHIDPTLSIEELQQQGWNITTNRKDRLKLFRIYNDN
jgi:hypothetical protein